MKKLLFIMLGLSLWSCNPNESGITTIDMLEQGSEIKNLSELATDIEFIALETNENSLTGYIHGLKTDGDRIYIFLLSKIFCFNKEGQFLYELDSKGRGPEEYNGIYDWDISPEKNLLMIKISKKIVFYNNTGTSFDYLRTMNFDQTISKADFIPGTNNILLSCFSPSGNEPLRNILINSNGDTLNVRQNHYKFAPSRAITFGMTYDNLVYTINNSIYFKEVLSDTVFTLNENNEIKPYLFLDTHGMHSTPALFANMSLEFFQKEIFRIIELFEVERYIIYKYTFKDIKIMIYGIHDKSSNKTNILNPQDFLKDDIAGGINFEPKFSSENKIYSWVEAFILKRYIASDEFKNSVVKDPEKKKALENLANSLKDTDNPVLIVVTPKE